MTDKKTSRTGTKKRAKDLVGTLDAAETIKQVNRIFRFATTNPEGYEYDAALLDELITLWEEVLFLHWPLQVRITDEQKRNLILAWKYDKC